MKVLIYTFKKLLLYTLVTVLLSVNKVLIHVVPFKKLIGFFSNASESDKLFTVEENKVKLIRDAIHRVRKIIIWTPVCFEQSLTALLLARFFHMPGTIYFGVFKAENGKILAHAWTQIGNHWVTGDEVKEQFTVVYKVHYIPKNW